MQSPATDTDVRAYQLLDDGTELFLRPIEPRDRGLVERGFEELSRDSRYQRFFTFRDALSAQELRALTESDGDHALALGLVSYDDEGNARPLGVARYVRLTSEPEVAEAAVTVVDAMHGRGLGKLLLRQLVRAARARGIERLRGEVLTTNRAMQRLLRGFDPPAQPLRREPGSQEYELRLAEPTTAPPCAPSDTRAAGTMPA